MEKNQTNLIECVIKNSKRGRPPKSIEPDEKPKTEIHLVKIEYKKFIVEL